MADRRVSKRRTKIVVDAIETGAMRRPRPPVKPPSLGAILKRRGVKAMVKSIPTHLSTRPVLIRVLQGLLCFVTACGLAFLVQPHGDKQVIPSTVQQQADKLPAGTLIAITGTAPEQLAQQRQLATGDRRRVVSVLSGESAQWEKPFRDIGRWSMYLAWPAVPAMVMLLLSRIRRRSNSQSKFTMSRGRRLFLIGAVPVIALMAAFPKQTLHYMEVVKQGPVPTLACHTLTLSCQPTKLSVAMTNQLELDPFAAAMYGGTYSQDPAAARAYTAKALQGQPASIADANKYKTAATQTNEGRRQLITNEAWGFTVAKNGPSGLLTAMLVLADLVWWLFLFTLAACIIAGFFSWFSVRSYLFLVLGIHLGYWAIGSMLVAFSWLSIVVPMATSWLGLLSYGLSCIVISALSAVLIWAICLRVVPWGIRITKPSIRGFVVRPQRRPSSTALVKYEGSGDGVSPRIRDIEDEEEED